MSSSNSVDAESTKKDESSKPSMSGFILLSVIALARLGGGLFISIHGPTLLTLAENVGSTAGQVSWLFSGRSVGLLAGGIATGFLMRKTNNMITFGAFSVLVAVVVIATPWIEALWLLVIVVMVGGIGFGYLDAGMQALILKLWGEKESRPLISGYHFAIAVGAFLAPIIAEPFLAMDGCSTADEICPASSQAASNSTDTTTVLMATTATGAAATGDPPYSAIVWAYLICGGVLLVVAALFLALYLLKTEDSLRLLHTDKIEQREEAEFRVVLPVMILICIYYFFCVAGETTYNSYIYSISICSGLGFSTSNGTNINSLFWLGFGLGRLGGVVVFRYFAPRTVIIVDLVGVVVSMTIMCVWGEQVAAVAWTVTFFYSFFQATIYPGGVSWASQFINMSGYYIFIFSAGQALGTMILVPIGGIIFDFVPFNVMYVVLGCACANALVFGAMLLEGERLQRKLRHSAKTCPVNATYDGSGSGDEAEEVVKSGL